MIQIKIELLASHGYILRTHRTNAHLLNTLMIYYVYWLPRLWDRNGINFNSAVPTRWNLLWVRLMSGSHSNLGCTDTHGFQFMTPNDASYLLLCQIPLCDVRFFVPRQHNARLWLLEILQQTTPGLRGPEGPGMIHTRHSLPPSPSWIPQMCERWLVMIPASDDSRTVEVKTPPVQHITCRPLVADEPVRVWEIGGGSWRLQERDLPIYRIYPNLMKRNWKMITTWNRLDLETTRIVTDYAQKRSHQDKLDTCAGATIIKRIRIRIRMKKEEEYEVGLEAA